MKIHSWNVNGVRAALKKGFEDYVLEQQPDILLLQETKATPDQVDLPLSLQECARGMFQKSVVVVSRYPYVNLFERLVKVRFRALVWFAQMNYSYGTYLYLVGGVSPTVVMK